MTDFVAACGGLIGLFMGISLLSIVEFFYYFSLRLFCSIRLKKAKIDTEKGIVRGKAHPLHEQPRKLVRSSNLYW